MLIVADVDNPIVEFTNHTSESAVRNIISNIGKRRANLRGVCMNVAVHKKFMDGLQSNPRSPRIRGLGNDNTQERLQVQCCIYVIEICKTACKCVRP